MDKIQTIVILELLCAKLYCTSLSTFAQGDARSASGHIIISVLSFWFGKERKDMWNVIKNQHNSLL